MIKMAATNVKCVCYLLSSEHFVCDEDGAHAGDGRLGHVGAALQRRRIELHGEKEIARLDTLAAFGAIR